MTHLGHGSAFVTVFTRVFANNECTFYSQCRFVEVSQYEYPWETMAEGGEIAEKLERNPPHRLDAKSPRKFDSLIWNISGLPIGERWNQAWTAIGQNLEHA